MYYRHDLIVQRQRGSEREAARLGAHRTTRPDIQGQSTVSRGERREVQSLTSQVVFAGDAAVGKTSFINRITKVIKPPDCGIYGF